LDQTLGQVEARSETAKSLLDEMEKLVEKATTEAETANSKMGAAKADLNKAALLQLAAQTQLIELVQKTQHLRHEALKAAHVSAGQKIGKVEALLEEKEELLRRDDHKECDKLRAQVIHAKAKLSSAAVALKNCLEAKKDIQAKIDKVEVLRAAAQKSLDQCLATKAKLKTALNECHLRRDSAREKLQECLERKKVLKVKIAECHEKRDEARKKLAACLAANKTLSEKIAAAKSKLGLLEVDTASQNGWEAAGDLQEALEALKAANAAFDADAVQHIEIEDAIKDALSSIQASGAEERQVLQQLREAQSAELVTEEIMAKLQTTIRDAYEDLKEMDAKADAAAAEADAAAAGGGED